MFDTYSVRDFEDKSKRLVSYSETADVEQPDGRARHRQARAQELGQPDRQAQGKADPPAHRLYVPVFHSVDRRLFLLRARVHPRPMSRTFRVDADPSAGPTSP
ncbi:MAG: hypothetical protein MZV70_37860 [Desulfobacterales bacterium]|nr:hypothetical protein [Desulfobacterales bacterium]